MRTSTGRQAVIQWSVDQNHSKCWRDNVGGRKKGYFGCFKCTNTWGYYVRVMGFVKTHQMHWYGSCRLVLIRDTDNDNLRHYSPNKGFKTASLQLLIVVTSLFLHCGKVASHFQPVLEASHTNQVFWNRSPEVILQLFNILEVTSEERSIHWLRWQILLVASDKPYFVEGWGHFGRIFF